VVLVLFAGNQAGALQVIVGDHRIVAMDARQLAAAVGQALGGAQQITLPYPVSTSEGDLGTFYTFERGDRVADFNWWWPSRALWDDYTRRNDPTLHYSITEFPFFSFWLGDMHPHVMALPFGLLALALALQTLARPAAPPFAMGRRGWIELALTGIVLGSLYAINSWDLPTYLLLFLGALLLLYIRLGATSPSHLVTLSLRQVWWRQYAVHAAMALLAAAVMFAPFHLTFRSLVGSKDPLVNLPILATITRTLGFVTWSHTPLISFLVIFGLFLLPLLVYVFAQGWGKGEGERRRGGEGEPTRDEEGQEPDAAVERTDHAGSWTGPLPWAILTALLVGPLAGFPLLVLLPLALYAALLAAEQAARPAAAFVLWAFALVCLICFGTEVVYIRDVFESRMNTIFKFYYQAWLIWGTLAAYAVYWSATSLSRTKNQEPRTGTRRLVLGSRFLVLGSLVVFVALLAGALVYPWLTAGKAFREGRQVGLAGVTPRQYTPAGAAAIEWLRQNAPADAVIAEAVDGSYDTRSLGFGGVSASTGLTAVLGWPGHEEQWRGGDPATLAQVDIRQEDIRTLFSTTSIETARGLLQKYKVGYVFVGAAERDIYPPEGLAKFDQLGTPVFQQDDVTIYQVPES
jgi:YYY domain-containing protein